MEVVHRIWTLETITVSSPSLCKRVAHSESTFTILILIYWNISRHRQGQKCPKSTLRKVMFCFWLFCFVVGFFSPLEKKIPCYYEILFPRNIGYEAVWTGMAVRPRDSLYKPEVTRWTHPCQPFSSLLLGQVQSEMCSLEFSQNKETFSDT